MEHLEEMAQINSSSWGKLGNAGVAAAVGAPTLVPLTTAINDQRVPGSEVEYVFDYLDRWETTVETNIGISSRFFEDRLSLEADYYVRDTEDAVVTIILPLIRENIRYTFASSLLILFLLSL